MKFVNWIRISFASLVLLTGCPKPSPSTASDAAIVADMASVDMVSVDEGVLDSGRASVVIECPATLKLSAVQSGVCADKFTVDRHACAVCSGGVPASGCLLKTPPKIYCVSSCSNTHCQKR